jgi:hypothetical protein
VTDVTFDFEPYDVLVAGEQFGEIRDAFIRLGISAVSCDLDPDRTGTGPHFQGNWDIAIQAKHWPLIIFPPGMHEDLRLRQLGLRRRQAAS